MWAFGLVFGDWGLGSSAFVVLGLSEFRDKF